MAEHGNLLTVQNQLSLILGNVTYFFFSSQIKQNNKVQICLQKALEEFFSVLEMSISFENELLMSSNVLMFLLDCSGV